MQTINILQTKFITVDTNGEDGYCWGPSSDGIFSVKTAYSLASKSLNTPRSAVWGTVWKLRTTQRIKVFLWTLYHGRLMTN